MRLLLTRKNSKEEDRTKEKKRRKELYRAARQSGRRVKETNSKQQIDRMGEEKYIVMSLGYDWLIRE
jgi:hypothetical protein